MIYCSWHLRFTNFLKAISTGIAYSDPFQHKQDMGETTNSSIIGMPARPGPFLFDVTISYCDMCVCVGQWWQVCVFLEKKESGSPLFFIYFYFIFYLFF